MRIGWRWHSVWRLALSALLALALMTGPVMAEIAMASQNCATHSGSAGGHEILQSVKAIESADHDAPHPHGLHADHDENTAKSSHHAADVPGHHDDGDALDAHGDARGDDCCGTFCQTACLSATSDLIPPLTAFNSFRLPVATEFISAVPGQPHRPPSSSLSI
jgi:hypothetical protein